MPKAREQRPHRIYLTGFMGCGKSTIGVILANVMGWKFIDLDEAIEERLGMPIATFFKLEGEPAFRAIETVVLHETANWDKTVIALGGGALANQANLAWALGNGTILYLSVSVDGLVERLKYSTSRPLLLDEMGQTVSKAVLKTRIQALFNQRAAFYAQAHLRVEGDGKSVGQTVDEAAHLLRAFFPF